MNRHPSLSTPLLATALLFASAGGVRAATFTVGGAADAACSHHSLAAAIAAAAANGPGMDTIRAAYAHAIAERYRFFSYGDAMLLEKDSLEKRPPE